MEETLNTSTEVSTELVSTNDHSNHSQEVSVVPKREVSAIENHSSEVSSEESSEWKPNFKLKAYDKEYEVPEKFRGYINKENEKDFRDTLEKSFAFDTMKDKNAKIRKENEQYRSIIERDFMPKVQRLDKLGSYLQRKDYDSFFEGLAKELPMAELQAWMLRKLQLKDLPPEQQALYNEQRAAQKEAEALREENEKYKQTFQAQTEAQQEVALNKALDELDQLVASPGISEIAKNFDTRLGQDGSYKIEVLRRAALLSKQNGKDLTVSEAIAEFNRFMGLQVPAKTEEQFEGQPPKAKPVLPSLNGKATSPAVQKIKSLDDLKKLAKASMAQASKASRE